MSEHKFKKNNFYRAEPWIKKIYSTPHNRIELLGSNSLSEIRILYLLQCSTNNDMMVLELCQLWKY